MRNEIFGTLRRAGLVASSDVLDYIMEKPDPNDFLSNIIDKNNGNRVLTLESIRTLEKLDTAGPEERKSATARPSHKNFSIKMDFTQHISTTPSLEGMSDYIKARYKVLESILKRNNPELRNRGTSIKAVKSRPANVADGYVIGMVSEVRIPKSGKAVILVVEDWDDNITVIIPAMKRALFNMPFVTDVVVGVKGRLASRSFGGNEKVMFADRIFLPDVPKNREKKGKAEGCGNVVIISDTHVGSNTFLQKGWEKFTSWLNGRGITTAKDERMVNDITTMVIAGDLVDGIGIYPGQEKELEVVDIYEQYEMFGKLMEDIPSDIDIIVIPGNHDAVRPAEPQPSLAEDLRKELPANITFLSNPAFLDFNGTTALVYHGRSIDDFAKARANFSHAEPIPIMKTMLKFRHIAPICGQKIPLAPEQEDHLAIKDLPDVFVTGHVHKFAMDTYRGVKLLNASAWQAQTEYQAMMNFVPDPCRIAVLDTATGNITPRKFAV